VPKVKKMKKAFTLIELVVAVGLLAMVLAFAGTIFNVSIDTGRTAGANAEIMQKLRAITDQLNTDFQGLQKDGYLILRSQFSDNRREYDTTFSWRGPVRTDRLYFFATGDFQSWFDVPVTPTINKSNIARVYIGHDRDSLDLNRYRDNIPPTDRPVSKWRLVHDIRLLKPFVAVPVPPPFVDYNDVSYAECKNDLGALENAGDLFNSSIFIDRFSNPPENLHSLLAQNVGSLVIQWTDGTRYLNPNLESSLAWFGIPDFGTPLSRKAGAPDIPADPNYETIEDITALPVAYQAYWRPGIQQQYWPKALKFTFTIYDSKGILEKGRTFTHIVYQE